MTIFVLDQYSNAVLNSPSIPVDIGSNQGDTLVALVAANSFGADGELDCRISSVIDDAHNTWFPAATAFAPGLPAETETAVRVAIWFCAGAAPATKVIATATETCDSMVIKVVRLAGVTNVVPLDDGDGNTDNTNPITADIVTTNDDDIVIAIAALGDRTKTLTHIADTWDDTTLFDVDSFGESDLKDGVIMRQALLMPTTAGVQSTSWTASPNGSAAWAVVALKSGDVDTTNPNPYWPQVTHELAFGFDPNDPEAVPVYTDVTDRVLSFNARRGRDYELARTEAGEADVRMRNDDGALNPENTTSPYFPNVRLMTPYRIRAKWNGQNHSVYAGYVERWPQLWDEEYGTSPMEAVDGLATLSATRLEGTIASEIIADEPIAYWPLDDGKLATEAANKAPDNTDTREIEESTAGGGSGFFGADLDVAGEESTCWEQTIHSTFTPSANSEFGTCLTTSMTFPLLSEGVLFECWAKVPKTKVAAGPPAVPARNYVLMALKSATFVAGSSAGRISAVRMDSSTGTVVVDVSDAGGTAQTFPATGDFADDKWHHYVVHLLNDNVTLWVDGSENVNEVVSTPSDPVTDLFIGGIHDAVEDKGFVAGRFAHVAVFALTEADPRRVAVRANAGVTGFPERSGARMSRLLSYAGWTAGRAVDEGLSLLGSSATIARQTLLQAVQDVANWENGLAFVDANGMFRFVDRNGRFFQETKWVFGDGNGEIPYETDVEIQYDPRYVYNDVKITKNAGRTSAGGGSARTRDQESIKQYFTRNLDKTTGVASIGDCIAEAQWALENYAQPRMRLAHITITPSANPELWAVALSAEIGDRVTVRRRPFGGEEIELDCYIEQVRHQVMPNKWTVTYSLSPVLLTTYFSEGSWVLGVSTLNQDTFLG